MTDALANAVMQPVQGAIDGGPVGFVKGMGMGALGLVVDPVLGITDSLECVAETVNAQLTNEAEIEVRRPSRAFEVVNTSIPQIADAMSGVSDHDGASSDGDSDDSFGARPRIAKRKPPLSSSSIEKESAVIHTNKSVLVPIDSLALSSHAQAYVTAREKKFREMDGYVGFANLGHHFFVILTLKYIFYTKKFPVESTPSTDKECSCMGPTLCWGPDPYLLFEQKIGRVQRQVPWADVSHCVQDNMHKVILHLETPLGTREEFALKCTNQERSNELFQLFCRNASRMKNSHRMPQIATGYTPQAHTLTSDTKKKKHARLSSAPIPHHPHNPGAGEEGPSKQDVQVDSETINDEQKSLESESHDTIDGTSDGETDSRYSDLRGEEDPIPADEYAFGSVWGGDMDSTDFSTMDTAVDDVKGKPTPAKPTTVDGALLTGAQILARAQGELVELAQSVTPMYEMHHHRKKVVSVPSTFGTWRKLDETLNHLVRDWARANGSAKPQCCCCAVINSSSKYFQLLSTTLSMGQGIVTFGAQGYNSESKGIAPGGCVVVFFWGPHPTILSLSNPYGHAKAILVTNVFSCKASTRSGLKISQPDRKTMTEQGIFEASSGKEPAIPLDASGEASPAASSASSSSRGNSNSLDLEHVKVLEKVTNQAEGWSKFVVCVKDCQV